MNNEIKSGVDYPSPKEIREKYPLLPSAEKIAHHARFLTQRNCNEKNKFDVQWYIYGLDLIEWAELKDMCEEYGITIFLNMGLDDEEKKELEDMNIVKPTHSVYYNVCETKDLTTIVRLLGCDQLPSHLMNGEKESQERIGKVANITKNILENRGSIMLSDEYPNLNDLKKKYGSLAGPKSLLNGTRFVGDHGICVMWIPLGDARNIKKLCADYGIGIRNVNLSKEELNYVVEAWYSLRSWSGIFALQNPNDVTLLLWLLGCEHLSKHLFDELGDLARWNRNREDRKGVVNEFSNEVESGAQISMREMMESLFFHALSIAQIDPIDGPYHIQNVARDVLDSRISDKERLALSAFMRAIDTAMYEVAPLGAQASGGGWMSD